MNNYHSAVQRKRCNPEQPSAVQIKFSKCLQMIKMNALHATWPHKLLECVYIESKWEWNFHDKICWMRCKIQSQNPWCSVLNSLDGIQKKSDHQQQQKQQKKIVKNDATAL